MKLYRFMDKKWLKKLEKTGKIRLNFLNDYKEEKYGYERGDNSEGYLNEVLTIDNYTGSSNENPLFFNKLSQLGLSCQNCNNISFKNVTLENHYLTNNYYVMCCSLDKNISLSKEFGKGILVINDLERFLKEINKIMKRKGYNPFSMGPCIYVNKKQIIQNEKNFFINLPNPAFLKEKKYSYQKEYRILWKPQKENDIINKPIDIICKTALKYCDFIYLPN